MSVFKQSVKFEGGPFCGRMADLQIVGPFHRGMVLEVDGEEYVVRDGPIAESIERQQITSPYCMILLAWRAGLSTEEEAGRLRMVESFLSRN